MTEQERPRTEAGRRLYRDTREGMTILQDAMRSRILAIEAEGRQQAVREIEKAWESFVLHGRHEEFRAALDRMAELNASESPPTETNPLYKTWTDSDEVVMAREDAAIKAEATTPETHEGRMLVAMFPHDADYWRNRVRAIEDEMNLRWEERLPRPPDGDASEPER